jgi:hypothetical protein
MQTRTKWMIAGLATLALVGVGLAAAQSDAASPTADMTASYQGKHVSFGYDGATGRITDYAADGVTLFDGVALADYNASAVKSAEHGRVVGFSDGKLARGVAFDAANAAFVIASPAGNTVTLVVPDGVTIEQHAKDPGWAPAGVLLKYAGNETGRLELRGDGNVSVSGQTITVTLGAHARIQFRLEGHPYEAAKEKLALLKLEKRLRDGRGKGKAA